MKSPAIWKLRVISPRFQNIKVYSLVFTIIKKVAPILFILAIIYIVWHDGYQTCDKTHIKELSRIEAQSNALLEASIRAKNEQDKDNLIFNEQLEKANEQNIATINYYHNLLNKRMRESKNSTGDKDKMPGTVIQQDTFKGPRSDTEYRCEKLLVRCLRVINYKDLSIKTFKNNCGVPGADRNFKGTNK